MSFLMHPHSGSLARLLLRAMLFAGLFCLVLPRPSSASDHQTPAVVWQADPFTVIAIQDRPGTMDVSLFSGPATPERRAPFFPGGKAPASITAFLIQTPTHNVLVDTGFGDVSPGASALLAILGDLKLKPEDIDLVLLTHMHMDHVGGLLMEKKRAFPKAQVAVAKPELDFWLDLAAREPAQPNAALVKAVIEAYGTDILPPFAFDDYVLPGVRALDASGHTPGHTVFLLKAGGKSLLIIGDLVHAADFQFALPEECAAYDMDKAKAVAARKRVLTIAAEENIPVAGMHIPFPSYGKAHKDGSAFTLERQ